MELLTPPEAEAQLQRLLSEMLEECVPEVQARAIEAARAEVAYKVGHAKALLTSDHKTVGGREADATVRTEELLLSRRTAENLLTATRDKLGAYRAAIDGVRTLLVGLRQVT